MNRYIISPAASRDLNEILDYFITRNNDAGEQFVQAFGRKCQNLAKFPNIGRSYDDLAPSIRGIPLEKYIILYRTTDEGIEIVRVVSGYRNLKELFLESDDT